MLVLGGDEYLTVGEAARLLGVKPATLYAYVSRGMVRSYRQGTKRRSLYRRAELEDLRRLAPAIGRARRPGPTIPLAESWIRE